MPSDVTLRVLLEGAVVSQVKIRGPIRSVVMSLFLLFVLLIAVKRMDGNYCTFVRDSKEDLPERVVWQFDNCNYSISKAVVLRIEICLFCEKE